MWKFRGFRPFGLLSGWVLEGYSLYKVAHCHLFIALPPASSGRNFSGAPSFLPLKARVEASQKTLRNVVLTGLSLPDFALLRPCLEDVELPARKMLEARHRRIEYAYFLESGMASVVVASGSQHAVEIGIIGREGMTAMALVMATDRSPYEIFMQCKGTAWRIGAAKLVQAMEESSTLRRRLLHHTYAFQIQTSFLALANARYKLEERLARWLLMVQDRMGGPVIYLTHELMSLMLGVRRPSITSALNAFQEKGMIRAERGTIRILKRVGLEEIANGCYGAAEAEAERLFGVPS